MFSVALNLITSAPFEGGQNTIKKVSLRADWWGAMTPLVYGNWPSKIDSWIPLLSILQSAVYLLGLYFILRHHGSMDRKRLSFFILLTTVGLFFVCQLWRDCTLLAFIVFGLGLITYSRSCKKQLWRAVFFTLGICAIIFGMSFKYIFAFFLSPLICLFIRKQFSRRNRIGIRIFTNFLIGLLAFSPVAINSYLARESGLIKTFPEQQPMIFDLVSAYCWGQSQQYSAQLISDLSSVRKSNIPPEAICASLEPIGWDTLHTDRPKWIFSSPIEPVSSEANFNLLKDAWLNLIKKDPIDYLYVKSIHLSQVFTMANFLGPRLPIHPNKGILLDLATKLVHSALIPVKVIDKLRLFSLGSCLLLISGFLWYRTHYASPSLRHAFLKEKYLVNLLLVILFCIAVITIAFVSGNGRYSFPFVFLVYLFVLTHLDALSKSASTISFARPSQ